MFDDREFITKLKQSDLGRQIDADAAEALAAKRRQLADALKTETEAVDKAFGLQTKAISEAARKAAEAERAAMVASAELSQLHARRWSQSLNFSAFRDRIENELRSSAHPAIREAEQWIAREQDDLRNASQGEIRTERGKPIHFTNFPSIRDRVRDLVAMREALHELKLVPDQSRVPEIIEEMKAALTKLKMVEVPSPDGKPTPAPANMLSRALARIRGEAA